MENVEFMENVCDRIGCCCSVNQTYHPNNNKNRIMKLIAGFIFALCELYTIYIVYLYGNTATTFARSVC